MSEFIATTLKKGNKLLYPTTYYNQVIMPDGTRWNGIIDQSCDVKSVNGKTGTVTLNASDIGAAPSSHSHNRLINGDYQIRTYSSTSDNRLGIVSINTSTSDTFYWMTTDLSATAKLRYILYKNGSSVADGYVYTTLNKPTYSDVGAAASEHGHSYLSNNGYILIAAGSGDSCGFQMQHNSATIGYVYIYKNNLYSYDENGSNKRMYYSTGNKPTYADVGAAAASHDHPHTHDRLQGWMDTRDVITKPNDYNHILKCVGIKTPTATGTIDGSSYSTLVGVRGWSDSSGGNSHEIAFTGNGKLYQRHGGTETWGAWNQILSSANFSLSGSTLTITTT